MSAPQSLRRSMSDLRDVKKSAKEIYDQWRRETICCPAFDGEAVVFSLKGWNHITGATGHKKRPLKDIQRRLALLPYAKQIIERSSTIQNITVKGGLTFFALEAVIKVEKATLIEYKKIRVILAEDKAGKKIFYSVMDKNSNSMGNKKGTPHA